VWNEVTAVASNLGIEIKLHPGGSLDQRRNGPAGKRKENFQDAKAYYRTFILYAGPLKGGAEGHFLGVRHFW